MSAQNLRTIPASAAEQSCKFSVKVVNKTAVLRAAQLANCILLHALFTNDCSSYLREHKRKLHIAYRYLTSWHNSIFGYKLRTIEAENP